MTGALRTLTGRGRGPATAALLLALAPGALQAEATGEDPIEVPSDLTVEFHDFVYDTVGNALTYRFRFVAPQIGDDTLDFMAVNADMEFLCNDFVLHLLPEIGPPPDRIVIVLMQEPVEFGVAAPGVVQFFESFSTADNLCILEVF